MRSDLFKLMYIYILAKNIIQNAQIHIQVSLLYLAEISLWIVQIDTPPSPNIVAREPCTYYKNNLPSRHNEEGKREIGRWV